MNLARISPMVVVLMLLSACVTINIYFPAAKAQEAAEKIVDDILGNQPEKQGQPAKSNDKQSLLQTTPLLRIGESVLRFLITPANAAQPDFSVDSPEIRQLQASMKNRHNSLEAFYGQGAIGFAGNALVAIRDASAVSLKDRARLKKLVEAENQDRNQLYQAIARANGHPEWEAEVRAVFAKTWISRAAGGWWFQQQGAWVQK